MTRRYSRADPVCLVSWVYHFAMIGANIKELRVNKQVHIINKGLMSAHSVDDKGQAMDINKMEVGL